MELRQRHGQRYSTKNSSSLFIRSWTSYHNKDPLTQGSPPRFEYSPRQWDDEVALGAGYMNTPSNYENFRIRGSESLSKDANHPKLELIF